MEITVLSKQTEEIETTNKMGEKSFLIGETHVTIRFNGFIMEFSGHEFYKMDNKQLIDHALDMMNNEWILAHR